MSIADIEKTFTRLINSAMEQWTQFKDDVAARPGCFAHRAIRMKPANVTQFQHADIIAILREKAPVTPETTMTICDSFVTTYPDDIFEKFMQYATLRVINQYQSEQYDCDDFSLAFAYIARQWHARIRMQLEKDELTCSYIPEAPPVAPSAKIVPHIPAAAAAPNAATHYIGGAPVGMCHGITSAGAEYHAFNFWISSAREVFFIEPQTGEFIQLGDGARIDMIYI